MTLGKYQDHAVEPYNRPRELRKKVQEQHKVQTKVRKTHLSKFKIPENSTQNFDILIQGGPFKLNLSPKSIFDPNVFKSDRPLPPEKPVAPKGPAPKPFKPGFDFAKCRLEITAISLSR